MLAAPKEGEENEPTDKAEGRDELEEATTAAGATKPERHAHRRPTTCRQTTLSDEKEYSPTRGTT